MSYIETIGHFKIPAALGASYEGLIEGVRSGRFGGAVRQAIDAHTRGARRVYLYDAKSGNESRLRYHSCEPGIVAMFPLYDGYYRRFDPVCDAYDAAPTAGDAVMQRVRPTDIVSADFRRRFFDDADIIERVSVIQRHAGGWRAMNIARHRSEGYFADIELANIVGLACLALPMLALDRQQPDSRNSLTVEKLEERFELAYPQLPPRERQVCARAAIGMSVEGTALDLDIGQASVMTYRKRAYGRLGVTSPFELCSLVMS